MKMISNSPNLHIQKSLGGGSLDPLKDENENDKPVWLITFVDLISLLLAFFLMLYSMSSIQKNDWAAFLASLNKHEVLMKEKKVGSKKDADLIRPAEISKGLEIKYLRTLLESEIESNDLLKFVEFFEKGNQLILSFPSSLIFRPGSSELLPKGKQALFALSEKLSNLENRVELVGYSDPNPIINNQKYKNNWVLSLFRASAVANALIKSGYRKPLNIVSLGDTGTSRIDGVSGQKRKYRRARRVDIVIHSERDKK
jgi:chemotaxis protein MotB